ncbi:SPX domain-containing protein, partial [Sparassis latifolia]
QRRRSPAAKASVDAGGGAGDKDTEVHPEDEGASHKNGVNFQLENNQALKEQTKDVEIENAGRSASVSLSQTHADSEDGDHYNHSHLHMHPHVRRDSRQLQPARAKGGPSGRRLNPEEYQNAKKKLKRAVLECYRGLEILNNYRTLNLIGFRKALKKFEKVTKIPVQHAYLTEKIEPSAFASGATVEGMIREMEDLFAARFARGDRKKAMDRLRGWQRQSHHFSSFKTGLMLGLALPAFVDGVYQSKFHQLPTLFIQIPGRESAVSSYVRVRKAECLFNRLPG